MKFRKILAAILLATLVAGARAAVVTLKDGSVLRGEIVGLTSDGYALSTPDGTLRISTSRILRIDYAEAPPAPPFAPVFAAPAAEEPRGGRQLLSLGIGLIQPVSKVNFRSIGGGTANNGDLGAQLGFQYAYYLWPRLAAGFDVDYLDRSGTISERLFPNASSSVGGDTWVTLGILRYTLTDHGRARPFILVGAGGARNSETVDVRPSGNWADTGTHETRRLIDDSVWAPAATGRIGVDVSLAPADSGMFTFETGWTGVGSKRYEATPQGQAQGLSNISGSLSILTFTARYSWRF